MPRGVLVELDDCLSKHINLLPVRKYSRVECISTWTVQREVLCQRSLFASILLLLVPLILCLQPPKPPLFPRPSPPALLSAGNLKIRVDKAEWRILVWSVAWWGHVSVSWEATF